MKMSEQFAVDFALPPSKLLKKALFVVRQAHHERKVLMFSIPFSFALSLSKGEQGVFQQPARPQCRKNSPILSLCAEAV